MHKFTTKIIKKEQVNHDVIFLSFTAPPEFTFKPGQFITIRFKDKNKIVPRSYSILNPPSKKNQLDFIIKLIPGGFASEIFEKCKVGDEFEAMGPLGHFIFDENTTNDHILIGSGTGLAPLYSMIKEYILKKKQKFHLIFSNKTQKDLIFHEELQQLEKEHDNFTYTPTLTREEWEGKTGRVQKHLNFNTKNKTFYICGIKELVMGTKDLLISKGVDKQNIKFERYN